MESPLALTYGVRNTYGTIEEYRYGIKHSKKRVENLKKSLKIQVGDTKHYQDKDKIFEIDTENYDSSFKYGLVLLYLAERNFLKSSMITQSSSFEDTLVPKSSKSKLKFGSAKLKKAVNYSKHLLEICFNDSNDSKKIEIFVYYALSQSMLLIRQKKWEKAAYLLSVARICLEFLEKKSSYEVNKDKHLYREIIENIVDRSLRLSLEHTSFAGKQLGYVSRYLAVKKYADCENLPDDNLEEVIELINKLDPTYFQYTDADAANEGAVFRLIDQITWFTHTARLYNSEIARLIMEIAKAESDIRDKDISSFDPVLLGWQTILENHELDTERHSSDEDDADITRDRQIITTYIKYHLYFNRIRRDVALVEGLNSQRASKSTSSLEVNKDILRIYGTIFSTIGELKDLPGVYSDSDLSSDVETLEQYFVNLKSVAVANSYEILKKYREALSIVCLIKTELQLNNDETFAPHVLTNKLLQKQQRDLAVYQNKLHMLAQFEHEQSKNQSVVVSAADAIHIPISISSIHEFQKKKNLLIDVESIRAVNVKPVFFDLAFNYVGQDEASVAAAQTAAQTAAQNAASQNAGQGFTSNTDQNQTPAASEKSSEKLKKKSLFGLWG